jgi:hypothetical protein
MLTLATNIDRLYVFLTAMRLRSTLTDDAERLRIWNSVKDSRVHVLYCCEIELKFNAGNSLLKIIAKHPAVIGSELVQPSADETESLRNLSRRLRNAFRRQQLKLLRKSV